MKTDAQIISIIRKNVMWNDPIALEKSLWRMVSGNRADAFKVIRETCTHWGLTEAQVEDFHIDCALAELNDGVEVEWDS